MSQKRVESKGVRKESKDAVLLLLLMKQAKHHRSTA